MRLSTEHERLVRMIKESISLMCKSSLSYDVELNVEGLLGITLDKRDIFLVNIKESFQTEASKQMQKEAESSEAAGNVIEIKEETERRPSARKRPRRRSRDSPVLSQASQAQHNITADYELPEFSSGSGQVPGGRTSSANDSQSEFEESRSPSQHLGLGRTRTVHSSSSQSRLDQQGNSQENIVLGSSMDTVSSDTAIKDEEGQLDFGNFVIKQEVGDDNDTEDFSFTGGQFENQTSYEGSMSFGEPGDGGMRSSQMSYAEAGTSAGADGSSQGSSSRTRRMSESPGALIMGRTMWPRTFCGREFGSASGELQHEHLNRGNDVACSICNKVFASRSNLNLHINGVHKKIKYSCEHCQKTFTQMGNLRTHQRHSCLGASSKPN